MPGSTPDPTAEPILSVVIPTLGRPTLARQLEALEACTWSQPWEILAVDNGSDGRTRVVCDEWAGRLGRLRYVDGTARRGRSHAINCGARAARGRWLAFCDDDDLVEPNFVAAIGDAFVGGARVVVFNFNVHEVNPPHVWQTYRHDELENGRPMFRSIPAFWGCSAIERDLFVSLGGFDEDRPYAEDLAFSVALHHAGIEPTWLRQQLLHYRLPATMRGRFRQRVQIVTAIAAISAEHPDISPPVTGNRWSRLVRALASCLARVPAAVRPAGRMVLADRLGNAWGQFTAAGALP